MVYPFRMEILHICKQGQKTTTDKHLFVGLLSGSFCHKITERHTLSASLNRC